MSKETLALERQGKARKREVLSKTFEDESKEQIMEYVYQDENRVN